MIKFRWVGYNKHLKQLIIHEDLTTKKILNGDYLSFFSERNRSDYGNCKFLSEDLFTGFKDKNKKDVYENDFVKSNGDDRTYQIKYSVKTGSFVTVYNGGVVVYNINPNILQVIGNKHYDTANELKRGKKIKEKANNLNSTKKNKTKALVIHSVVGQSEQLCNHENKTQHFSDVFGRYETCLDCKKDL